MLRAGRSSWSSWLSILAQIGRGWSTPGRRPTIRPDGAHDGRRGRVGLLGHAVASRLLAAGHQVVGYDVLPEKTAALAALGGTPTPSAADVARAADPVCTLLPSLATVEAAILGLDGVLAGARAGQTLVQMSTISPALTERLAREAEARGVAFLDCPVSGTSAMVARGDGILFVGGAPAVSSAGGRCSRRSCRAPSTSAGRVRRWS